MSGHNPHGRLGQPNASWNNHLQIPSYIPRQPQLAHMSNERGIVRSPPTWHTPIPSEQALFNFMSAASHNPLELKPLLPGFVAPNPPPFGSVDLTLSAARNNLTPSPRNLHSPGLGSSNIIQQPPPPSSEFSIIKSSANCITTTSSSNSIRNLSPTPGVIQTTGSCKEKYQSNDVNNGDLIGSSNNINKENNNAGISTVFGSGGSSSNGTTVGGLFIKDANQINSDITKLQARDAAAMLPSLNSISEPVELVNTNIYSLKNQSIPTSPTRKSPTRPSSIGPIGVVAEQTILPENTQQTEININSPPAENENFNNNSTEMHAQPVTNSPSGNLMESLETTSVSSPMIKNINEPQLNPTSPVNNSNISEDSVDSASSSSSKNRRKRKPNKSMRVPNENLENNISLDIRQNNDKLLESESELIPQQQQQESNKSLENKTNDNLQICEDVHPPSTTTNNESTNTFPSSLPDSQQIPTRDSEQNFIHPSHSQNNTNSNNGNDHDDVETIDKIAEMIAKTKDNLNHNDLFIPTIPLSSLTNETNDLESTLNGTVNDVKERQRKESEESGKSNNEDTVEEKTSKTTTTIMKNNHFEDVENKLEELFAGIEDDRPPIIVNDTINNDDRYENVDGVDLKGDDDNNCKVDLTSDNNSSDRTKLEKDSFNRSNEETDKIKETVEMDLDTQLNEDSSISNVNSNSNSNNSNINVNNRANKSVCKSGNKRSRQIDSSQDSIQSGPSARKKTKKQSSNNKKNSNIKKSQTSQNNSKSSVVLQKSNVAVNSKEELNYRGPYIQIKRDGEMLVVNGPISEDDPEKTQKVKKNYSGQSSSERNQIRGLHVSTLSIKYDADTRDTSWICVFCKLGPHKNGLGDLFGPYILTTDCEDFQYSQIDPANDLFKSHRTRKDMIQKYIAGKRVETNTELNISNKKKKKTSVSETISGNDNNQIKSLKNEEIDVFAGMTKAGEKTYEVWVHEDCAVWAPGVYIIGVRIIGLELAVWSCSRHKCTICSQYGAMLCCLERGCSDEVHIPCAKLNNWTLSDSDFKSRCEKHKLEDSDS